MRKHLRIYIAGDPSKLGMSISAINREGPEEIHYEEYIPDVTEDFTMAMVDPDDIDFLFVEILPSRIHETVRWYRKLPEDLQQKVIILGNPRFVNDFNAPEDRALWDHPNLWPKSGGLQTTDEDSLDNHNHTRSVFGLSPLKNFS